jgi:filamentous hemagglutinin
MKLSEIVERASIDPRKLTEYALNPEAPWGQHKAVVFEQSLGINRQNYAGLLAQIEQQVLAAEAVLHSEDAFG